MGKLKRRLLYLSAALLWCVGVYVLVGLFGGPVLGVRIYLPSTYSIPSGSNIPTLVVGDYVVAWRNYYRSNEPQRGDMAHFKLPSDNTTDYMKRIVGLPGDRIQMKDGLLHINREPVGRELAQFHAPGRTYEVTEYIETLPNGLSYRIWEDSDTGRYDNTPEYLVPPGHYFVLGDNRDHSNDSRALGQVGFVPRDNLRDYPTYIFWAKDRSRIGTPVQPLP